MSADVCFRHAKCPGIPEMCELDGAQTGDAAPGGGCGGEEEQGAGGGREGSGEDVTTKRSQRRGDRAVDAGWWEPVSGRARQEVE